VSVRNKLINMSFAESQPVESVLYDRLNDGKV